jgi:regulator of sigma E protease
MSTLVTALVAIAALSLLILVHECGRYAVARVFRIRIERLRVGFGPKLLGWTSRRTATAFQVSVIPFGGFLEIRGMNAGGTVAPDDRRAYGNRPDWQRLVTILGGPAASYLAASALAMALYTCHGVDGPHGYQVGEVIAGYDAHGKLRAGDRILDVDGAPLYIDSGPSLIERVNHAAGAPITLTIERDGQQSKVQIAPTQASDASGKPVWRLGLQLMLQDVVVKPGVIDAAGRGLAYPASQTRAIAAALYRIALGSNNADPGGPVRMVEAFQTAFSTGAAYAIKLVMLLSVYVGLIYLLPLPGLDGWLLVALAYRTLAPRRTRPTTG